MRKLIALAIGLCCAYIASAQISDSAIQSYYAILDKHREGKGNGSFNTNISVIQNFFVSKPYLKDFENSLEIWGTLSKENGVPVRVKSMYNTIPLFEVSYVNVLKTRSDIITVEYGLDKKLCSIGFEIVEDDINVDRISRYVSQLKEAGYVFDVGNTRLSHLVGGYNMIYYKNPRNKVRVMLACAPTKTHVTVFKY